MSFQKIENIKKLNIEEIEKNIIKIKKEIFDLQIKKYTRQSLKNHVFKHKKHQLAQFMTLATQKIQTPKNN
uniref:Large ribosomal subunit protein uL29c n=2 Tax=Kappaphycus TaxID=38543 RepID=A0A2H4FK86_9FLOR|nr:50S ribosomal protein L29 [Kappaphycus striatus]